LPHDAIMVEHRGQGEHAFGWTFQVSYQAIGADPGDRLYESPYHVGIADQGEAKAALEKYITPLEGTEIKLLGPVPASLGTSD
jgi:hypothetical protein